MPDDLPFVPDATLDLVDAGWWLALRVRAVHQHPPQAAGEGARAAGAGAGPAEALPLRDLRSAADPGGVDRQPGGRCVRLRLPAEEARTVAPAVPGVGSLPSTLPLAVSDGLQTGPPGGCPPGRTTSRPVGRPLGRPGI